MFSKWKFWFFLLHATSAVNSLDYEFLEKFIISEESFINNYYIINCHEIDYLSIAKTLSQSHFRYVTLHHMDEPIRSRVDEPVTFLLHLRCRNWKKILLEADDLNLYRKPYQWILLDENIGEKSMGIETFENITFVNSFHTWNFLSTLPLLVDSDVKVFIKDDNDTMKVISPYKLNRSKNDLIEERLARWTPNEDWTIFNKNCIAVRRRNLQGLILRGSTVVTEESSKSHLDDLVDKHVDTSSKVTYNAIKEMETILNISIKIVYQSDWGRPLKNGSWSGMMGDLITGKSDVGAAPLFFTANRLEFIEYYGCVNPTRMTFLLISPPLSHANNIFVLPFASTAWLCCFILFTTACFLLFVAINFEELRIIHKNSFENYDKPFRKMSFAEIFTYNIGAICLQGTAAETHYVASRIITIFVYFSYVFLYTCYSASIVAILQSSDTSIQTIQDLLNSHFEVAADDVSYSVYYFKNTNDSLRKKFYNMKMTSKGGESSHFMPPEEGIKRVRNGLFAYHTETTVGYDFVQKTYTESEKCGLQETRMSFINLGEPWLVIPKYSPYSELFRIYIKRIISTGFKSRYAKRYYTGKPSCGSKSSKFFSIGISDIQPAFMILIYGIGLAITGLILEILFKKYSPQYAK